MHVGLQIGREPVGLVAGDQEWAEWTTEVTVTAGDFRGSAVQGKKGDRFVYLTWGTLEGGTFTMFRRAKLMLADLPSGADLVTVDVDLTDERGMPRCARLTSSALRVTS